MQTCCSGCRALPWQRRCPSAVTLGTWISAAHTPGSRALALPGQPPWARRGPVPRAGGEGTLPIVCAPPTAQKEAAGPRGAHGLGVEAGGLWFLNEASGRLREDHGSDWTNCSCRISLGGFWAPKEGRDSARCPGVPPLCVSRGSGRGQHLWPSHLFSEAGLGFGGVSTLPWEPSWPGLLSPGRTAHGPLEPRSLRSQPFSPSLQQSGGRGHPLPGIGWWRCPLCGPHSLTGSRKQAERVLVELNSRKSLHLHKESWQT